MERYPREGGPPGERGPQQPPRHGIASFACCTPGSAWIVHCVLRCVEAQSRTAWSYVLKLHGRTQWYMGSATVKFELLSPSRSRLSLDAKFSRRHASARPERATRPWCPEWPKLRDNHRILWLGHQVSYTHYLPWPGDQPGRPSWPWKCAYVRSTAMPRGRVRVLRGGIGGKLKCDFFVLSVPAAVGHCFMSILTHPNR